MLNYNAKIRTAYSSTIVHNYGSMLSIDYEDHNGNKLFSTFCVILGIFVSIYVMSINYNSGFFFFIYTHLCIVVFNFLFIFFPFLYCCYYVFYCICTDEMPNKSNQIKSNQRLPMDSVDTIMYTSIMLM